VFSQLCISLISRSESSIVGHYARECLNKSDGFEQKHGHLAIHLTHNQRHGIVDDSELSLNLRHETRTNEDFNHKLLALDAFKGSLVLDVESN